jgi:hypothetical protein
MTQKIHTNFLTLVFNPWKQSPTTEKQAQRRRRRRSRRSRSIFYQDRIHSPWDCHHSKSLCMRIPLTLTELLRSKNPYTASQIVASQALDSARLTPASSSFPLDCSHESPQFTRLLSMKMIQSRMKNVHTFARKVSLDWVLS